MRITVPLPPTLADALARAALAAGGLPSEVRALVPLGLDRLAAEPGCLDGARAEKAKRSRALSVRLGDGLGLRIACYAEAAGLTAAEVVRRALAAALGVVVVVPPRGRPRTAEGRYISVPVDADLRDRLDDAVDAARLVDPAVRQGDVVRRALSRGLDGEP